MKTSALLLLALSALCMTLPAGAQHRIGMAGPTIGFLLSAKLSGDGQEVDFKDFLKSTDFGLNFGGGINFPAGNNAIFVEGRYALGLSNINDDPENTETKIKNEGIQFLAGVTFPLGGGQ